MRKVLRISATALSVASLSLVAIVLPAAGAPPPVKQVAAAVWIKPFQLMERAADLPVQQIEDFSTIY